MNARFKRFSLYAYPEGYVLTLGLLTALILFVFLIGGRFLVPDKGLRISAAIAGRLVAGRPAGVYLAYALGLNSFWAIFINMAVDTAAVCLIYPIISLMLRRAVVWPAFDRFYQGLLAQAKKNEHWIRRYGVVGLFLFVFFPLWGTGPVVGCVLGTLMRLNMFVTLAVVLGATLLAILGWAWIFPVLQTKIGAATVF